MAREGCDDLLITAVSGTGASMTVVVEDSPTGQGSWTQLATFGALGAVGTNVQRITGAIHEYVRVRSTAFSGTSPSFTFSVRTTAR